MPQKTLLVCGIGSGMQRSLPEIRELVDELIVLSDIALDPVLSLYRSIQAYPRSEVAVLTALREAHVKRLDGVFSLGYENPRVIARVGESYGCRTLPYEIAATCLLKDRRIRQLEACGVPVPRHRILTSQQIDQLQEVLDYVGLPCIVKPNDKTSSIGVNRADDFRAAVQHVQSAIKCSEAGVVVIEQYLEGSEHTIEGIVSEGTIYVSGFSDRNYDRKHEYYPHVFEDGDTLPTHLEPPVVLMISEKVSDAIRALGLDATAYHADVLLSDGRPYVLEVTPRIAGSRFGTELVPLSTGVRVLSNTVRLALGEPIALGDFSISVVPPRAVVSRFLPSPGGTVQALGSIDEVACQFPCVYDCQWEMSLQVGQHVRQYHDGKDMLASVICVADSVREADECARKAIEAIPIRFGA